MARTGRPRSTGSRLDLDEPLGTEFADFLAAHHTAFAKPDYRFGFVPPWWLGIIIYNPAESVTVAQAQALATDIHGGVSSAAHKLVANPGEPGVECGPGHIICGFILPPDERPLLEE